MSNVEEKIETVKSRFAMGNLIAVLWILLGTFACWLVNPWLGWFFLGFSAFSVYLIIRRLICNSCYYCKSCTKGLAKLSILFLGANRIPGQSNGAVKGMVIFIYTVLTLIPTAFLIYSLVSSFETLKIISLVCLIGISAATLILRFRNRDRPLWKR